MSAVSDILTAGIAKIQSTLGSTWTELNYIYQPEKNDFRSNDHFGFGVGGSETVTGVTKAITVDQTFFLLLSGTFHNRKGDSNERAAIASLYEAKELVDIAVFQKKIDIPGTILVVQSIETEEPFNPSDGVVMLKSNYIIKHRTNT